MLVPSLLISAIAFLPTAAQSPNQCDINDLQTSYAAPVASNGWASRLIASGLTKPRSILFDTEKAIIVVEQRRGIVHLELEDKGQTCLRVSKKTTLIEDDELNHGLALSEDGRTLYASTVDSVYSWPYDPSGPSIDTSSRRKLVTNMKNPGHSTRTLMLSQRHPSILLVSLGSGSNMDPVALNRSSGISQIRSFNISALRDDSTPYDYTDGDVLGWGLRNSVGIGEHPRTGGIWSVENSADEMKRNSDDIHADNPGEELNFHGYLNGSKENRGENYGYPVCFALWSTDKFPNLGNLTTGDQFSADFEADTDAVPSDAVCNSDYVPPALTFQAHMAPLDIKFNANGSEAFISFHGSWNRENPVGYHIARVSFDENSGKPSAARSSQDATEPVIRSPDLSKCPDECVRPVGLAWDSEGRLWFSSDSTGEIFVLDNDGTTRNEDGNSSGGGDGEGAASALMWAESSKMALIMAGIIGFVLA